MLFELFKIRGIPNRFRDGIAIILNMRNQFVKIIVLLRIIGVICLDRMTNTRKIRHRLDLSIQYVKIL